VERPGKVQQVQEEHTNTARIVARHLQALSAVTTGTATSRYLL